MDARQHADSETCDGAWGGSVYGLVATPSGLGHIATPNPLTPQQVTLACSPACVAC